MIWILIQEKKQNMILKNTFLKLMNNAVFGKTMENVRKIEILNYLVSEPNCHPTKFFTGNLLVTEMK